MIEVRVTRTVAAARQRAWDLYTDHVSWQDWAGMGRVRLDREGDPAPNGTGCVRVITSAGVAVHEEVVEFNAPTRMTYRLVRGGIPIRDHLGEVDFTDDGEGTRIDWRARFNSKIPGLGWLFKLVVNRVFNRAMDGLERRLASEGEQAA